MNNSEKETDAKKADVILYEKRAAASECIEKFETKRKWARVASLITAAALCAPTVIFALRAYDSGDGLLAICEIIIYAALVTAAHFITGAVLSRSFSYYMLMMAYRAGWRDIIRRLEKIEEKAAEKTAFEDDVRKIEQELSEASDLICSISNGTRLS